jgi:ABC-2 type transport system ATP-binding protein
VTAPVEEAAGRTRSNAAGAYAIAVEDMSVWYGRTPAVHHLSMHVPPGSIYGLVGPSGAGKSTAMRVLATLQRSDAGTVVVDGVDIRANPAAARSSIGYLPDFSGLYESLTISEYLDFYGAIYGVPVRRRRSTSAELLELIGLMDQRNSQVKSLSRGMRQKLGLARCLVHDPGILLLDEPAAGMDPASRLDLRDILQELARLRKTILICSHLLSEVGEVCSHLGIMRAGELIAEGSVSEIMRAISPESVMRIHLLRPDDAATAQQILETLPTCHDVTATGASTLVVRFEGTPQDRASILGQLSGSGVQVTEFAIERPTLEDVFLRVITPGGRA